MRPSPSSEALMSAAANNSNGSIIVEIHDGEAPTSAATVAAGMSMVSIVYRACDLSFSLSAMLAMQLMYSKTWSEECDIELKVWSTGWLALQTLRSFLRLIAALMARYAERRTVTKLAPLLSTTAIDLTSFGWFLYGIFPIFVDRNATCGASNVSYIWSLVGWSMQAFVYFFPCLVIIICVPAFVTVMAMPAFRDTMFPVIFRTRNESTNQQPTPEELLSKLHPMTFGQAVSSDLIDLEQRNSPAPPGVVGGGGGQDGGGQEAVPNLITASLPETLSHAVNSILTRLGSQGGPEGAPGTGGNIPTGSGGYYHHSPRGFLTCPICVMEFEADDEILRLPCDSRHHVFHRSCIVEWLRKSQHCPMCRKNIAQLLQDLETDPQPPAGADPPQARHTPPTIL